MRAERPPPDAHEISQVALGIYCINNRNLWYNHGLKVTKKITTSHYSMYQLWNQQEIYQLGHLHEIYISTENGICNLSGVQEVLKDFVILCNAAVCNEPNYISVRLSSSLNNNDITTAVLQPLYRSTCLQCFDAVGWAAGRALAYPGSPGKKGR